GHRAEPPLPRADAGRPGRSLSMAVGGPDRARRRVRAPLETTGRTGGRDARRTLPRAPLRRVRHILLAGFTIPRPGPAAARRPCRPPLRVASRACAPTRLLAARPGLVCG